MIRCDDSRPGRLVIRSRSMPTGMLAVLATSSVLVVAVLWLLSVPLPRVVELECDRGAGRCRVLVDGIPLRETALAEVAEVEARPSRGGRLMAIVITRRSGESWPASLAERPERARRDVAELKSFLSGSGRDRLTLRWDHALELLLVEVGGTLALLLPLVVVSYPTVCTVDRVSRRVRVRFWRERERTLEAIASVRVQTGVEDMEERRRLFRERNGREPGLLGPRIVHPRRARARRILLVDRDGSSWPITSWLVEREDPQPVAERLRTFLS